jgi:epoxyqueuosine reductase
MTGEDVRRLGEELGLDAVGVARAEAYDDTERMIRERRARGLFAEMKFTMAQPEISCHPEALLPGARSVVSAALCYWQPEEPLAPGHGRLARYTWDDAYTELRDKLTALGDRLGGAFRVLVDANQHVDRAAAARSGVGFYGKNTLLITRRYGSWVVLGALVTDVDLAATPPLDTDCGECRLCIDACPTGALDVAGTLDATRCLSYWTQAPHAIPEPYRKELGSQVYGCDICQDVCPWNRGVEKRRDNLSATDTGHIDLREWLEADGRTLVTEYDRLFVPRNDPRWLRRNALVALGNTGDSSHEQLLERFAADDDELLAEHAAWALAEVRARN